MKKEEHERNLTLLNQFLLLSLVGLLSLFAFSLLYSLLLLPSFASRFVNGLYILLVSLVGGAILRIAYNQLNSRMSLYVSASVDKQFFDFVNEKPGNVAILYIMGMMVGVLAYWLGLNVLQTRGAPTTVESILFAGGVSNPTRIQLMIYWLESVSGLVVFVLSFLCLSYYLYSPFGLRQECPNCDQLIRIQKHDYCPYCQYPIDSSWDRRESTLGTNRKK